MYLHYIAAERKRERHSALYRAATREEPIVRRRLFSFARFFFRPSLQLH